MQSIHQYLHCRTARIWFTGTILWLAALLVIIMQGIAGAEDAASPSAQAAAPPAAKTGLDSSGHMHIHKSDRCPLCAMLPARYPEFSCGLQLSDNRTYYFCSPRCLLRVWANPKRFLNVTPKEIVHLTVRHYFTGEQMDGKTALWVSSSNVIGPMGPALIPLKTRSEVAAFKQRHGAGRVFRLMELTQNDWRDILGE